MGIDFEVWRVEQRTDADSVDFWDFLTEESARKFISGPYVPIGQISIRQLGKVEIVETALQVFKDTITTDE